MTQDQTYAPLSAEQAGLILRFLERASLQGGEAPIFMELCGLLAAMARPAEAVQGTPASGQAAEG